MSDDASMARGLDQWVQQWPAWLRGWGALVLVGSTVFAIGFAAGSWGVRDDLSSLRDADQEAASVRSILMADVATNRSNVATLESIIQQAGLEGMSERMRRMDRELCLVRVSLGSPDVTEQQCVER